MISQNRKTAEKKGHSQGNGPPFLSRETPADRRLHSAGHFAGTQAAGAGVHTLGSPVDNSLHTLDVGLPSPVRTTVGVRDLDAERHILTAIFAFCHVSHLLLYSVTDDMITDNLQKSKLFFIFCSSERKKLENNYYP